jgi:hypothetical protein
MKELAVDRRQQQQQAASIDTTNTSTHSPIAIITATTMTWVLLEKDVSVYPDPSNLRNHH